MTLLARQESVGPFTGAGAAAWRDATLGRLAAAALDLAAAEAAAEHGDGEGGGETVEWARLRFEALCGDAARAAELARPLLAPSRIAEAIGAYRNVIGDVEPLAPDVDWALDPLLRREPAAAAGDESIHAARIG